MPIKSRHQFCWWGTFVFSTIPAFCKKRNKLFLSLSVQRKVCLRPEKRAAFSVRQQHYYFFSSIFADGKRTVRLFYFKPQRALSMRRKIERRVDKDIPSKTLAFSASFAGALRKRTAKHIPYSQDSSINFVPHNYTLCIINYPLFSAFYRQSRPAVWFDSG